LPTPKNKRASLGCRSSWCGERKRFGHDPENQA
jgi:hypothetical protein